jgi:hypothetical protein
VTNKPKAIGTRGETAIVNVLRAHGFGGAERRALAGSNDLGDILICPGVIAEVKWGKHAKTASLVDVSRWLRETERERANAGAHLGAAGHSAQRHRHQPGQSVAVLLRHRRPMGPGSLHR